jgi:hypothetical protein
MWLNPNSRGSRLRIWQPWGCKSLHAHHFAPVVQCRDGALKTRTVLVQIRPWAILAVRKNSPNLTSRFEPLNHGAPPLPACGHPLLHSEWRRGPGRGGAPVHGEDRNRASAQAGFISQLRRGRHSGLRSICMPATTPPRSSPRISFVKVAGRDSDQVHLGHLTGNAWEAHSCRSVIRRRSELWQDRPAGVFNSICSRSPMQRHDVENVASAGANPAASTSFRSLSYGSVGHFK